jgi:CheY-like chemotaxis protein
MGMGHEFKFEVVPLTEVSEGPDVVAEEEIPVVLVVDDEPLIVNSLAAILSHAGLKVTTAYNGAAALEAALEMPPHLLLTDVAMPGMNGVDLAMAVSSAMPECRVLLFSAHASMLDLSRARAAGFDFPVLAKPLHPLEMLKRVFAALEAPLAGIVRDRKVTESFPLPLWAMPQVAS